MLTGNKMKHSTIICFAKIDFKCPHCGKEYDDNEEKYLERSSKNKCGYTKIKCNCGKTFGMTYNYMSDAVSFKIDS